MKKCPECQFIYEDNDRQCDMDGSALVHARFEESSTLASPPAKRSRIVLLFAVNLVLVAVVAADYYSFSHQNGSSRNRQQSAKAKVTSSPFVRPVNPETAASPAAGLTSPPVTQLDVPPALPSHVPSAAIRETTTGDERAESKTSEKSITKRSSSARAVAKERQRPAKPVRIQQPQDSKVRSILKKAGHFLKKPF